MVNTRRLLGAKDGVVYAIFLLTLIQHPFIQTAEPLNTLAPLVLSARKARAEEKRKKGGM
jgi:hypothetical protein